ncbi:MAG: response regulator [Planctomycetes bacterium]|nr:response regulator [Planctomycetota bacterium]
MKPSILFVDDEPNLLASVRDMLRKHRTKWDMTFCPNPDVALELLARNRFDLVVSDMRMPRVDGAMVLTRAMELQPHSIRVVLSGQTNREASMRAVKVAHRFIGKPIESNVLITTLEELLSERSNEIARRVREFVGGIERLPSAPTIYLELQACLSTDSPSVEEVAEIVGRDPAIVAKLLQIVNSAFFGLPRRITSIVSACTYLGVATISDLVLVAEVCGSANASCAPAVDTIRRESLLAASIARTLVNDRVSRETTVTACLLHDIGLLLFVTRDPEAHAAVARRIEEGVHWRVAEVERFGFTHIDAGLDLLGTWGLPVSLKSAVASHHGDLAADSAPADAWTHVATRMAANALAGVDVAADISPLALGILGASQLRDEWRTKLMPVLAPFRDNATP